YSAEVWYFGKTKERKDKLVIRCSVREEGRNVEFFVASNSILVVTGLLAELKNDFIDELKNEKKNIIVGQITDERTIEKIRSKGKLIDKLSEGELSAEETKQKE
ncbi:MAG: hypothetical protein AB1779_10860, partial [Candidatus Thermoplasmatota archaeon]